MDNISMKQAKAFLEAVTGLMTALISIYGTLEAIRFLLTAILATGLCWNVANIWLKVGLWIGVLLLSDVLSAAVRAHTGKRFLESLSKITSGSTVEKGEGN